MKKHRVFRKVFLYTLLFLFITICVTVLIFARQFQAFYKNDQIRQFADVFMPLYEELNGESVEESIKIAEEFYQKNQSYDLRIKTADGKVLFETFNVGEPEQNAGTLVMGSRQGLAIYAINTRINANVLNGLTQKILFAVVIMLAAAIFGALLFARGITNPIRRLAEDTHKMAALEPVTPPVYRQNEFGQLANDVHNMYEKLKQTIIMLEEENEREREMEENQRYFFSAASHELKTPVAALTSVVEGMLANVGDYKDHPKYLRECLKMLTAQSKIIYEILDIVNLSDDRIGMRTERVNLSELLGAVTPEYLMLAESKGQTLTIDISDDIYCYADRNMLGRANSNVIMNAVQNLPEGVSVRIWCNSRDSGGI